ncbi:MAG: DUF1616 domain-containing protein [Halobacteriota archaeon]
MSREDSSASRSAETGGGGVVPIDIIVSFGYLFTALLLMGILTSDVVRTVLMWPLMFFIPGYLLVAALFPHAPTADPGRSGVRLGVFERSVLSFGLSVGLVPLFGLVLELVPVNAFGGSYLIALSVFIIGVGLLATVRRAVLPARDRFTPPTVGVSTVRSRFAGDFSTAGRVGTILLVVSIVFAVGAIGYAISAPQHGEAFSQIHLTTTTEDGQQLLDGYPQTVEQGETVPLTVGVENRERHRESYTVVVVAEQVVEDGDTVQVLDAEEIDRFELTIDHGSQWSAQHELQPDRVGLVRYNYYLFRGEPPTNVDDADPYRHVFVTIDVTES